jgi:hypothetical protein
MNTSLPTKLGEVSDLELWASPFFIQAAVAAGQLHPFGRKRFLAAGHG